MTEYREVPWKRNYRVIPAIIKAKLDSLSREEIVVGCVRTINRTELEEGVFDHLKLQLAGERLIVIDRVLPPAAMGKFSRRNREGWVEVRKDLPKYKKTFSFDAPNFGDWSNGSHTVSRDREVYHRDIFEPLDLCVEVRQIEHPDSDSFCLRFIVTMRVDRGSEYFEEDLLFALNLLQENTGEVDILRREASDEELFSTLELNWEIFPPKSDEDLVRAIRASRRNVSTEELSVVKERIAVFSSLNPVQLIRGRGGLNHYIGAQFAEDLVVFENIRRGNALYVLYDNWQEVSQLSRREILRSEKVNYHRIEHKDGWIRQFRDHMFDELKKRGLGPQLFKPAA